MSAFDLGTNSCTCSGNVSNSSKGVKEECLIAFKVYDFFRLQECLTAEDLGFARALETSVLGNTAYEAGDIIAPPEDANSVTIEDLDIQSVNILSKKKNTFRNGYYDVTLQFVFVYTLTFSEAGGCPIGSIVATNTFTTKLTLFGSIDTDVNLSTDLFGGSGCGNSVTLDANPFIWVESKAIALAADFVYPCQCPADGDASPTAVRVTIGLFAIIKLFRIVNLLVESKGFCIPEEISDISSIDPCEFFDNLDFPMDSFAPPQKPEFVAGISSNIPASKPSNDNDSCGCKCGCGCG